ncbi:MAG: hypothetical protein R3E88_14210 [Myxococcota bacterium]
MVASCAVASFRLALVDASATDAAGAPAYAFGLAAFVNAGRVLVGAACGALLGVAGRLDAGRRAQGALAEVETLAVVGAASGAGLAAAAFAPPAFALLAFLGAAVLAGFAAWALVRRLDRPSRAANLAIALVVGAAAASIAFAFVLAQERRDAVAAAVAWMLGDLSRATPAGGSILAAAAATTAVAASLRAVRERRERAAAVSLFARAVAWTAAGPIAGIARTASRAVDALDGGAPVAPHAAASGPAAARMVATAMVGAALVTAIDTGGRLLVGGFAPPVNVDVAMLSPLLVLWHRSHLRRRVGRASPVVAALEWTSIAALAALAAAAVWTHAAIVAAAY